MQELVSHLSAQEHIQLVTHVHPDGDAIGSTLALAWGLHELGKNVTVTLPEGIPRAFAFLANNAFPFSVSKTLQPYAHRTECLVILDAPDAARTGDKQAVLSFAQVGQLYLIDHHRKGDLLSLARTSLHNTEVSSASELVFDLLCRLEVKITAHIATCLLTGIYTDTGGFQYANAKPKTLETVAELMRRGAKLNKIVDALTQQKSMASLRLLGIALDRMYTTNEGDVLISAITHSDLESEKATADDLSGINGELTTVAGPRICMFLRESTPGEISGSLRCSDSSAGRKVNVRRIARLLGGNGHPAAAGFTLPGKLVQRNGRWQVC